MKLVTALSIATITALLIGCGGGGGGDSTPDDNSSPSTGTTGSTTSTSGTPIEGSTFTITSIDSVRGYTITSNESTLNVGGQYTMHQRVSVTFACDGSFEYTIVTSASGASSTTHATGYDIGLDDFSGNLELSWSGTDNEGEPSYDSLTLNSNNQLVTGSTCWEGFGSDNEAGANCPNNLYVESVTQNTACN